MYKVFVDGQEGTTGLQINERLAGRTDIEVLKIPAEKRKDLETKREYLNNADIVFLCLPDQASMESVSLITNENTKVIDASTAHRTNPDWVYGLPEIKGQREKIKMAKRVSNPGCHATGFNAVVAPLVHGGIIPPDYPITAHSITGYSGAGKKAIELYESENKNDIIKSPRLYALSLAHKHLPEMKQVSGLDFEPVFTPIICDFYKGMNVSVLLNNRLFSKKASAKDIHEYLADYYKDEQFIKVMNFGYEAEAEGAFLDPLGCNNTNNLEIYVSGNDERTLIIARLDNLGKGASGAAVQNMNIMIGADEKTGLL